MKPVIERFKTGRRRHFTHCTAELLTVGAHGYEILYRFKRQLDKFIEE